MAFLRKVHRVELREKHCVQVNLQEVIEVFAVLARKWIGRPIACRKGVHKRVQRPLYHHEEWIANRESLAATKGGVLKDVGHSCRI